MEQKKTSSLNYILIFFLSYSFYTLQVLTQLLFNYYSKQSVIIICSFYMLLPVIVYFICSIINKNKHNIKENFIYSILSNFYLIITCILSLVHIANITLLYYYQQSNIIILLIFLSIPIIYTIIKGENNFLSLASILVIIYIAFKYAYLFNPSSIDTYVFYDIFKIDKNNIFSILLLSFPILLEPLLLLNNQKDMSTKINIKGTVILSILISIISIMTIFRQTWEFGALLDKIRFPYLESIKNIVAGKFFENIDYYYLLSLAVSIYTRTSYTLTSITKSFNTKKTTNILFLLIIFILSYLLHSSLQLANFATNKMLIISSTCLLILLFIPKRRKTKNA